MKFALAKKLLLGFVIVVALAVLAGVYAISSLRHLKDLTDQVVRRDLPTIEAVSHMTESLLAQDLYKKRYLIVRDGSVAGLFQGRGDEFERHRLALIRLGSKPKQAAEQLGRLHGEYRSFFQEALLKLKKNDESGAQTVSEGAMMDRFDAMLALLRDLDAESRAAQNATMLQAHRLSQESFVATLVLCIVGLAFGVGFAILINSMFVDSIRRFKEAADQIGQGQFDRILNLQTAPEVGELAESFRYMSRRLKELEQVRLDASPLTRLPGNLAIEREMLQRLQAGKPFAFCLADIDNFKPYGDYYGYARGSEVLKRVGEIISGAVKEVGQPEDFVGHIGGDDFVMISVPERIEILCDRIIIAFDKACPEFYDQADRERGYILSHDRKNVEQVFPFMTISLAVVTNQLRPVTTPVQVAQIAAQLKQHAKSFPQSIYIIDQRRRG